MVPAERVGPEDEKVTINLGPVDLGRIDLLVREGVYSSRTDFIRDAIRSGLDEQKGLVDDVVKGFRAAFGRCTDCRRRQLQTGEIGMRPGEQHVAARYDA